jgi:hypothetical protein
MSMLLLVGCSSDNPVISSPEDPPDDGQFGSVDDAMRPGDPEFSPPAGFDKGDDAPLDQRDREDLCR